MSDFQSKFRRIEPYLSEMHEFAYSLTKCLATASDIVQDAIVRACTTPSQCCDHRSFRSWLRTIILNTHRDNYRTDRSRRNTLSTYVEFKPRSETDHDHADSELNAHRIERIRDAIRKLSNIERETIILRIYNNHTFEEIGKIRRVSAATAQANFTRALNRLKGALSQ